MATKAPVTMTEWEEQFHRDPYKYRRLNSYVAPWWPHTFCFSPQVIEGILRRNGAADMAAAQLHKDQTEAHAMDI